MTQAYTFLYSKEGALAMGKRYAILVRVESVQPSCMGGHYAGEEWRIMQKTPEGICLSAMASLLPAIRTLQFGGTFPWEKDPNVTRIGCTASHVTFRVERLEETCPP
jgi:uncharacterized repeat protein (TIGR04076 family)